MMYDRFSINGDMKTFECDVCEKGGGSDLSLIEGQDGPVKREANRAGRQDSYSRFHHH